MASGCDEFNRFERILNATAQADPEQRAFERHAAGCASCQAQWIAHAELVQSGHRMQAPVLPEDFNHRLRNRLKEEIPAPAMRRNAGLWLHGYWVLAALLSLYIVVRIDWPWPLVSPWIPALLILMILTFVVVELVPARSARRVAAALGLAEKHGAIHKSARQ